MRQKDVNRIAEILEKEVVFATRTELEGVQVALRALASDLSWAQPELDVSPLHEAADRTPLILGGWW